MEQGQEFILAAHGDMEKNRNIRIKMFVANVVCCVAGAAIMAAMSHYLLMAIFVATLVCMGFTGTLIHFEKITSETACLLPMLLLCFVLTPVSWFTFAGPMGCTPYLTLAFSALIIMTHYRKIQTLLLSLYFGMIAALSVLWIVYKRGDTPMNAVGGNLAGYALAVVLITGFLLSMNKKNEEASAALMNRSLRDELTGLYNRRVIEKIFDMEESRFVKQGANYAVMMLDIDRFKQLNDDKGHPLGDAVLKDLAARITDSIRTTDYAVRYGGDEFMIVLADATADSPQQVLDRINLTSCGIRDDLSITVSMGYALRSECATSGEMIALSDRRMYDSKRPDGNH